LVFSAHAKVICTGDGDADAAAGKTTIVVSMIAAAATATDSIRNPGQRRIPSMAVSPLATPPRSRMSAICADHDEP
jgi:hypothetical protein